MPDTLAPTHRPAAAQQPALALTPSRSASVLGRVAWVSDWCPPQLPAPRRSPSIRQVKAPHHQTGLPAHIDMHTIDRFCLEPVYTCAARQHQAGRPYVYMHIAARTGLRHAPTPQGGFAPWLSLTLTPDEQDPRLSAPALGYTLQSKPSFAHIDNIFFFCLLGADAQPQWLGSLHDAATDRVVQLIITTLLVAERGEPQALLRAGLMFEHGLGIARDKPWAKTLTQSAYAQGATDLDVAAARASMLFARDISWLAAAFGPQRPITPSAAAHESVGSLTFAVRQQWLAGVVTLLGQGLDADAHWPSSADDGPHNQPILAALQDRTPSILRVLVNHSTCLRATTLEGQRRREHVIAFAKGHASASMLAVLGVCSPLSAERATQVPTVLGEVQRSDTQLE